MILNILPMVFDLGMSIVDDVKQARSRNSDGGRKITAPEWRRIVSHAAAKLAVGLTTVFASDLEDDAQEMFSDRPQQLAA